jgi:hypothetical protein
VRFQGDFQQAKGDRIIDHPIVVKCISRRLLYKCKILI